MTSEPRYPIRAVERLTGVPAPTLRSWERRYGFPVPARTASGHRLYTEADVQVIRWLQGESERGAAVSQAIEQARHGRATAAVMGRAESRLPERAEMSDALVQAAFVYDERALDAAITEAFIHYPADSVLLDVLTPALVRIGEAWASGEATVAVEHFIVHVVRQRLMAMLAAHPGIEGQPAVLLACLPGEQHELGLMMLALFLCWAGARPFYFGANMPVDELARLGELARFDAICLSGSPAADWSALPALTEALAAQSHRPAIFLGGGGAAAQEPPEGVRILGSDLRSAAAAIVSETT